LRLTHPMEGFPWDDLRKILYGGQNIAKRFNRLSRVHQRYRQQTDWR